MTRKDKLDRLAHLADLKATLAKSGAAQVAAEADALSGRIRIALEDRRAMAAQTPDPITARAHATWLRHCDQTLRALRSEQARLRVRLDAGLDRARLEEGRRQVLEKLKHQAS
jgi:hypothetical protein